MTDLPTGPGVDAVSLTAELQDRLARPFDDDQVGKLPRLKCPRCRDAAAKVCADHQKVWCGTCHQMISTEHLHLDYVGHAETTRRLLEVDPRWNWEPMALDPAGWPMIVVDSGTAVLWIRLTVAGVTRLGVGTASATGGDYEKELIGDAIRNAAMRFGVALDLWSKEARQAPPPESRPQARSQTSKPAGTVSSITGSERTKLRALCVQAGIKFTAKDTVADLKALLAAADTETPA